DAVCWPIGAAHPARPLLLSAQWGAFLVEAAKPEAADDGLTKVGAGPAAGGGATAQEAAGRISLDRSAVRAAPRRHRSRVYLASESAEARPCTGSRRERAAATRTSDSRGLAERQEPSASRVARQWRAKEVAASAERKS